MKNKEKFAKEILDIVCNNGEVAMDKTTKKLNYCEEINCDECYFSEDNYPHNAGCTKNFVHWANSEYKEKKEFSEADKALVKGLDKLNWFARDKSGDVWGFVDRPSRGKTCWYTNDGIILWVYRFTSATFEPLSWDDEEPTHREEILK